MTITFEQALDLLEEATVVLVALHGLDFPGVDREDETVNVSGTRTDGPDWEFSFHASSNPEVRAEGCSIWLKESADPPSELIELRLLTEMPVDSPSLSLVELRDRLKRAVAELDALEQHRGSELPFETVQQRLREILNPRKLTDADIHAALANYEEGSEPSPWFILSYTCSHCNYSWDKETDLIQDGRCAVCNTVNKPAEVIDETDS